MNDECDHRRVNDDCEERKYERILMGDCLINVMKGRVNDECGDGK